MKEQLFSKQDIIDFHETCREFKRTILKLQEQGALTDATRRGYTYFFKSMEIDLKPFFPEIDAIRKIESLDELI